MKIDKSKILSMLNILSDAYYRSEIALSEVVLVRHDLQKLIADFDGEDEVDSELDSIPNHLDAIAEELEIIRRIKNA